MHISKSNPSPVEPPKAPPEAKTAPTETPSSAKSTDAPKASPLAQDQLDVKTPNKAMPPQIDLFSDKPQPDKPDRPWKLSRMHINAGYVVHNNIFHTGPMHIQHAAYDTDVTITGIQQTQRTNWENLTIGQGHRFAPDEPQFIVGVNLEFANQFGLEIDAKHNKIIVDGYDQEVHFDGVIHGEEINGTAPLNTLMRQHEQTLGNMEIGFLATRNFDLARPGNGRFSFITKAGPALIVSNTRSALVTPSGEVAQNTSKLGVVGYGFEVENGLRYEFGPKLGRMGVEVAHGLSYMNFAKYPLVNGGTGSHDAFASQFSVKLTKAIEFKK